MLIRSLLKAGAVSVSLLDRPAVWPRFDGWKIPEPKKQSFEIRLIFPYRELVISLRLGVFRHHFAEFPELVA
jgi:hypothetical protein